MDNYPAVQRFPVKQCETDPLLRTIIMDTYQAVYDAVRSRLSGCDIGAMAGEAIRAAASEYERPSVLFRPTLSIVGDQWCALFGENLQIGVCGFGDSPEAAMRAFDGAWFAKLRQKVEA